MIQKYITHYRALASLGIPIVIGNIGNVVLNFADTLMIGHYGMKELAAASFVNTLFLLLVIFAVGFSMGLTPIVGSLYGRGDKDRIGGVVRAGIVANALLAVILTTVCTAFYFTFHLLGQPDELLPLMRPYLLVNIVSLPFLCLGNVFRQFFDAIGETRLSMTAMIASNITNIIGNYLLIFGKCGLPELGLLGAGISTTFSRMLILIIFVCVFFACKKYSVYAAGLRGSRTDRGVFRKLNALGWPSALQVGMETAAFSFTAIFVGWIGTTALAAHQVMLTISGLFYMVYLGFAVAVAVRVSHFNGQRDRESVITTTWAGFHLILLIAAVVSVPVFLLRHEIGGWFTDDAGVSVVVAQCIVPLIVYQFGDGLQCTFANALRGLACMRPLMYAAFVAYFIVSLPLSWLLGIALGFGLPGIWAAFPVCLMVAGLLYWAIFNRRIQSVGK